MGSDVRGQDAITVEEIEGGARLEWMAADVPLTGEIKVLHTRWGAIIRDDVLHLVHITYPRWWAADRKERITNNIATLIELRRSNHDTTSLQP